MDTSFEQTAKKPPKVPAAKGTSHYRVPKPYTANNSLTMTTTTDGNTKTLLDKLAVLILDSEEEDIQLAQTIPSDAVNDLLNYRVDDKDGDENTSSDLTLLQLAVAYSVSTELMEILAGKCPGLLFVQRLSPYEGQTPVHTLVSKENVEAVKAILQQVSPEEQARLLKISTETNKISPVNATVMLGGLPLSIAALTFNLDMVDALLDHGAEFCDKNDRGDTVFHSLVRFSALYPEKESRAEEMMDDLHQRLKQKHEPRSVWLTENNEGVSTLKLAAQCTQAQLFNFIITLKGVYCDLDEHDGLFDSLLYDITDIDPVALKRVTSTKTRTSSIRRNQINTVHGVADHRKSKHKKVLIGDNAQPSVLRPAKTSVLDIIYETDNVDEAFKILDNHIVHCVIQHKWSTYAPLFCAWTVLHLFLMVWLTTYAVYKSRLTSYDPDFNMSTTSAATVNPAIITKVSDSGEQFVYVTAILSALWSVLLLVYELMRAIRTDTLKEYVVTLLFHHNGFYRLQLILMALCLLADAIVLAVWVLWHGQINNYFLIAALLVGWWFTNFFLRPWKKFSFFTVMLQEVLLGDMLRFSTIFIPQLLAFSIAMHITYLPSMETIPPEFQSVGRTMMTMFKLMLGLSDIGVLYLAPQQWLAILLFVIYVVLTYSLMLNALIALMSNTCSIVSQNRENQWKLQRLSIVLFLQESLGCLACLTTTGSPRNIKIEDLERKHIITITRFVMKISSVRGGDGGALLHSAVKNLVEGDAGEPPDEPVTRASSDMYDLLAALNLQRKEKRVEPQDEDEDEDHYDNNKSSKPTGGEGKIGGDVNITVHNHKQRMSTTYVSIRQTIQKRDVKSTGGRPTTVSQSLQQKQNPQSGTDDPDGAGKRPSSPKVRPILNDFPAIHPVPQPNPTIVLLPSPCMITSIRSLQDQSVRTAPETPGGGTPRDRSEKRAEKKQKFRRRPDSAELQERFQKRREQLRSPDPRKRRRPSGPSASARRPPSASSATGHGVFPVELDDSRIHMHTTVQQSEA